MHPPLKDGLEVFTVLSLPKDPLAASLSNKSNPPKTKRTHPNIKRTPPSETTKRRFEVFTVPSLPKEPLASSLALLPTDRFDGSPEPDLAAYRVLTQLGLGASA